jgi:UDP-N-acetylglucosamine 2-epimerase (non-hydrolysing)
MPTSGPAQPTSPKRVMVVFGTRPEAIKVAPVIQALAKAAWSEPVVAVTAQHRRILDQVLELFDVRPDHDLDIIQPGQTLTDITVGGLHGLGPALAEADPDLVLVQGDTTTTFAGALAAFYQKVPVAHLEAGLRTGNVLSPYPEEMNRRLTSQLASLHLAPTPASRANLLAEGVDPASVVVTGNTVIDALHWTVGRRVPHSDPALASLDDDPRRVLLVTAHRRESWGQPMAAIGAALADLAHTEPDLLIVLPIHPNRWCGRRSCRRWPASRTCGWSSRWPTGSSRGCCIVQHSSSPTAAACRRRPRASASRPGDARHDRASRGRRGRHRPAGRHRPRCDRRQRAPAAP